VGLEAAEVPVADVVTLQRHQVLLEPEAVHIIVAHYLVADELLHLLAVQLLGLHHLHGLVVDGAIILASVHGEAVLLLHLLVHKELLLVAHAPDLVHGLHLIEEGVSLLQVQGIRLGLDAHGHLVGGHAPALVVQRVYYTKIVEITHYHNHKIECIR